MPPQLGTLHPLHAPVRRRRVTVRGTAVGMLAAALVVGAAACSEGDPQIQELRGWERAESWPHPDVVAYDRVATTAGPDGVAWLTWASGRDDTLAYREVVDGGEPTETELEAPEAPVVIPLGVANDDEGWVAVAATRERPNGENTGLMAWQPVSSAAPPRGQLLAPPEPGLPAPVGVNAGRAAGTDVVAGVAGGQAVAWISNDGGRWEGTVLELGLAGDLAAIDLAGHGDELVLAGVDADGGAHLWTSPDGRTWEPGPTDDLPSGSRSVTVLGSLDEDELALAWMAGGDSDGESGGGSGGGSGGAAIAPRAGTTATVQRFDGRSVADEGTIEARPDAGIPTFSLDGATLSPDDHLVVVGTASPATETGVPMIWLRDGDAWEPSTQRELAGRVDYQFRAITTTSDGQMMGLITPAAHIDLELWRWIRGEE
jgi:hypothetical protein